MPFLFWNHFNVNMAGRERHGPGNTLKSAPPRKKYVLLLNHISCISFPFIADGDRKSYDNL